jgi:hypothetical protein
MVRNRLGAVEWGSLFVWPRSLKTVIRGPLHLQDPNIIDVQVTEFPYWFGKAMFKDRAESQQTTKK